MIEEYCHPLTERIEKCVRLIICTLGLYDSLV
jgi:hypothetical protein